MQIIHVVDLRHCDYDDQKKLRKVIVITQYYL